MNIVFDAGMRLDDDYIKTLVPLLPEGNPGFRLDPGTGKTDGTPEIDEGFVFITELPTGVLKYHAEFFESYSKAPQWFFILINKQDWGMSEIKNAARRHELKNCEIFRAKDVNTFAEAVNKIAAEKSIVRGKALLLSKHKVAWTADFANMLFGENENKYVVMNSVNMSSTDAEVLFLCGEEARDFRGLKLPERMEPYFLINCRKDLQLYLNPDILANELAGCYHMTVERVKSRLCFINPEIEKWLSEVEVEKKRDALSADVLLYDEFGLPASRTEYSDENVMASALKNRKTIEKIMELLQ